MVVSICFKLFELSESYRRVRGSSLVGRYCLSAIYNANTTHHAAYGYLQCRGKELETILQQMPRALCSIS